MVWLHGGGFTSGSGADYDPTRLVAGGQVIVVTVNYRLGALGFLDLPELARQDPYAGNFALADQQTSLRWLARNAAAFGGDPTNITVFGQSGGAIAICAHLASPGSRLLFQRAIIQSGPCGNALVTAATAEERGMTVAAGLGCPSSDGAPDTMACLRGKPAGDLVDTGVSPDLTSSAWEYVADTPAIPEQPLQALRDGTAAPVPLIQGSTHDEMRQTVAAQYDQRGTPLSAADYPAALASIFGDSAPAVLAHYPLTDYPSPSLALATALTDWGHVVGACQVLPADDAASRRAPVYAYEFAQDSGQHAGDFPLGATHGSDLPYLFDGTFTWSPPPAPDPTLSARMIGYWTRFARTGNPNTDNVTTATPSWPRYHPGGPVLSLSVAQIAPTDFATQHQCAFWNRMPA
jgi:para-nitrobenzyl esterase